MLPEPAAILDRSFARLRSAGIAFDPQDPALRRLLLASDFAVDTLVRHPALFASLDGPAQPPPPSRTPPSLATAIRPPAATESSPSQSCRAGKAETPAATPAATETATVRT